MGIQLWLPIVASCIAAAAAISVPVLTYRFAIRQEYRRWLREQRMLTYVDCLAMMNAASDNLRRGAVDAELRTNSTPGGGLEQAARIQMFASPLVLGFFKQWSTDTARVFSNWSRGDAIDSDRLLAMAMKTDKRTAQIAAVIRTEMGSDELGVSKKQLRSLKLRLNRKQ